jgi:hypothetical protein
VKSSSPQAFGRYQVEAEIGRGAMGVVYRARDPKIDRLVAIKTISLAGQEPEAEQAYRERFVQEAHAAGRLSHPGIVAIFDAGEDQETHEPYLVMEHVAGDPLSRVLAGGNHKLPLSDALQFAHEIAEALDYAHLHGVIHRDIKPANILITEGGRAKIADFGVARLNQSLTTHSGQIFGSPAYMAPEQLSGGEADARSDLFSLGVMLYSLITGFRPFQGNSAETVSFKVMNIEPVPVTSFQHDVPPELDAIIARAMAKRPADRFQSGAEMAQHIQSFREKTSSVAEANSFYKTAAASQPGRGPQQRRGLRAEMLWVPLLVALVVAGLITAWHRAEAIRTAAEIQPEPAALRVPSAPALTKTEQAVVVTQKDPAPRKHHGSHAAQGTVGQSATRQSRLVPAAMSGAATAKVQVEILHHFEAGKASIWVDDQLVSEEILHGDDQRHPLFGNVEMNQTTSFQFSAGKHLLQVRVISPANTYDQIETLDTNLPPGSEHVLHVNCDKRKMQVTLQ